MLAYVLAALLLQPAAPAQGLRIEVFKARRELVLYSGERRLKNYRVGLGLDPVRPKRRQGDRATPEGRYTVCRKNPASAYYLSLGLTYPNGEDAERGLTAGLISRTQHRRIRERSRLADARRGTPPSAARSSSMAGAPARTGRGGASPSTIPISGSCTG